MCTKTHQIAQFKTVFSGGACPRTPLAKRMATCKYPNLRKLLAPPPPLPNPEDSIILKIQTEHRTQCPHGFLMGDTVYPYKNIGK